MQIGQFYQPTMVSNLQSRNYFNNKSQNNISFKGGKSSEDNERKADDSSEENNKNGKTFFDYIEKVLGMDDENETLGAIKFCSAMLLAASSPFTIGYAVAMSLPDDDYDKVRHEQTQARLTDIFTREDSEKGGKITYDEQCQIREIDDDRARMTEKYHRIRNKEKRKNLEDLHDELLTRFSSSKSDKGSQITFEEQMQILDFMQERERLLNQ